MTNSSPLRIEAGAVVALRLVDLGHPLDLDRIGGSAHDVHTPRFPDTEGLSYGRAPAEIELDEVEIRLDDGSVFADATARVFDFGVVAYALRVLVGGFEWDRFEDRVEQIESALRAGDAGPWRELGSRLADAMPQGFDGSASPAAQRDYTVVVVRRANRHLTADDALREMDVAALVAADRQPLSSVGRDDILRGAYSYYADDLVVVGRDRAFLLDEKPGSGAPDAVEAALVQHFVHEAASSVLYSASTEVFAGVPSVGLGSGGALRSLPRASQRTARATAARAGEVLRRADALIRSSGRGRLAGIHGVARDRLRGGEMEITAERRLAALRGAYGVGSTLPGPGMLLVLLIVIAIATVILVAVT